MDAAQERWIDDTLGRLDLDQKVGQLMVFGFCGTVITPDIVDLIRYHHLGGVRISQAFRAITLMNDVKPGEEPDAVTLRSMHAPAGFNKDYASASGAPRAGACEYAATLNDLRRLSLDRAGGLPIHFTIDQEGSGSDDLLGGQRLFPHPMGLAASGDPAMAYRVADAIAQQARAVGVNMIHSPVLDVNSNPLNPEVGTRAYSDNPETVTTYALQTLRGFQKHGLMATGKHFPGRGESVTDAHWGLPQVDLEREALLHAHVAPYRTLIEAGLPCIMAAHSVYPALGDPELPASLSRRVLTEFLRGELGFQGVITTDNMMMGGILKRYEMCEAIVQALIAGNDLVLCRDESPIRYKILDTVKTAIAEGRLSETEVDTKVKRILELRWAMGLVADGGLVEADRAADPINDPEVVSTARDAAERSVLLLRDRANTLPLNKACRVLLIEQIFPTHAAANNMYSHPGLLWEELSRRMPFVGSVEIRNVPTDDDVQRVERRLAQDDYDAVVTTNYYYHKAARAIPDVVDRCRRTAKPVVVVTNTPYAFGCDPAYDTVVAFFQPGGRENIETVAKILAGDLLPTAKLPVRLPNSA